MEEIDVIVNSLLDVLLRTILEVTSCPQAAGSTMRLQFQDVTVSITAEIPIMNVELLIYLLPIIYIFLRHKFLV